VDTCYYKSVTLSLDPIHVPLSTSDKGVVYMSGTRIPIDFVIYEYLSGATAEDIAQNYPSLRLSTIHAVLSYYLSHKTQVDAYIAEQEKIAESKYQEIAERSQQKDLRQRLLSRLGK
jgi:uncharacterized protein (DUF433 family)